MKRIALYCGAAMGVDPDLSSEAVKLSGMLAQHGYGIVYGGSKTGLMGAIATAALDAGGEVIGVEPAFLIDKEVQLEGLTELIAVDTMPERRTRMIELSDGFVALPGGIGTLDEITEVLSLAKLGRLGDKPICVLNAKGCYDAFAQLLMDMAENGFVSTNDYDHIEFLGTAEEVFAYLNRRFEDGR